MAMGTKDTQPEPQEQPEPAAPVLDGANVVEGYVPDVDRVAVPSIDATGQPAQTPGFVVLDEPKSSAEV